jgi:proprotein convertase subtilisin/kexin type 5
MSKCQKCGGKCATCIGGENQCIKCFSNRINPPFCECPIGTYNNTNSSFLCF